MLRHEILHEIAKRFKYQSYIEIGLRRKGDTYNHIPCQKKYSVDINPDVDADFKGSAADFFAQNKQKFDLILVDACLNAECVLDNILGAVKILNDGGLIACHCTLPVKQEFTIEYDQNGTAWKPINYILKHVPQLHVCTLQEDHGGLSIIVKNKGIERELLDVDFNRFYDYSVMDENRAKSQNVIPYYNLFKWIEKPYYQF